jgi:hypothetical protein
VEVDEIEVLDLQYLLGLQLSEAYRLELEPLATERAGRPGPVERTAVSSH